MYVLGSPHIKGQSEEIFCGDTKKPLKTTDLKSGAFASLSTDGKVVGYSATLPLVGVVSQVLPTEVADVCKRGYKVPCLLVDKAVPVAGAPAYVGTGGAVTTTGTQQIGTFHSSDTITAYDPTLSLEVSGCAFVDVAINTIITASTPAVNSGKKNQVNSGKKNQVESTIDAEVSEDSEPANTDQTDELNEEGQ